MYYRQSCTGWLVGTGIICIFIGAFIGPMMGGVFYVIGGFLMLGIGVLIGYLKYRRGTSVKSIKKELTLIKRCPTCGTPIPQRESNICPNCGNNL